MKRFSLILFVILIIVCPFFTYNKKDDFFTKFNGVYSFVTNKFDGGGAFYLKCEQNGLDTIVSCDIAKREVAHLKSGKILGEILKLDYCKKMYNDIVKYLSFQIEDDIFINGTRVLTGYSKNIKAITTKKGKKINTQIAINNESIIVGIPLIKTSF